MMESSPIVPFSLETSFPEVERNESSLSETLIPSENRLSLERESDPLSEFPSMFVNISLEKLALRRKALKKQRKIRYFQGIWRSLLITGLAGGLFWVTTLPNWVIRRSEQIEIEGNHYMSPEQVRSLLKIIYPQSIWQVQPQSIISQLEQFGPIENAQVSRQLMPPRLIITITERQPVAQAVDPNNPKGMMGFLDEQGNWMPKSSYPFTQKELPPLKAVGFTPDRLRSWAILYQTLKNAPLTIREINWQDPNNLILKTPIGLVYCGSSLHQFDQQMIALAKMRNLSSQINPADVLYIDLRDPQSPALQMKFNRSNGGNMEKSPLIPD